MLVGNSPNPSVYRTIDFELDYNYDEVDDASKQSTTKDKLKPIEKDLRHLEKVMQGIVDEMEYLKAREVAMRDTNGRSVALVMLLRQRVSIVCNVNCIFTLISCTPKESTNARVKWFSLLSLSTLVGSGLWQVWYLRRFFHQKKLL